MGLVKNVDLVLNFDLREDMVDSVHHLANNSKNPHDPRWIIVKSCRLLKMDQMRSKTGMKSGFSAAEIRYQSESKVFVDLSLSRETRVLCLQEPPQLQVRLDHQHREKLSTQGGGVNGSLRHRKSRY